MKISRNKAVTMIATFLMLSMVISIFALPNTSAHDPAINITTSVRISVAPNPVGVNQMTTLVFWNTIAPPDGTNASSRWVFNVQISDPSNVTTTLGDFTSDANGLATTTFTPTSVGTYTVTVTFPATVYKLSGSAAQRLYTNDTFLSSKATATFVVQSTAVPSPMPVDYSSTTQSDNWFKITSNFYGTSMPTSIGGTNNRRVSNQGATGPLTPHIMWTRPLEAGGIVGGDKVGAPGMQFYTGGSYYMRFQSYFIMDGRLYYREPYGTTTTQNGPFKVLDLATGTEILTTPETSIAGYGYSCNGVTGFLTSTVTSGQGVFTFSDASTLRQTVTIGNAPTGTQFIGPSGEHYRIQFVTTSGAFNISQWNSSKILTPGIVTGSGGTYDGSKGYDFNVNVTYNGAPFSIPSTERTILTAFYEDVMITTNQSSPSGSTGGVKNGYRNDSIAIWAISLKPGHEGEIIGNVTMQRDFPNAGRYILPAYVDPINHMVCAAYKETRSWTGINYITGQQFNTSGYQQGQLDYYGDMPNGALGIEHDLNGWTAFGRLYSAQYSGIVYCYDTSTMKLAWTFGNGEDPEDPSNSTSLGLGAAWGRSPTFIGGISADGYIYTYTNEHSINTPIYKGAKTRCLDAMTGELIWELSAFSNCFTGAPAFIPPANGFLVYVNAYDEQIYALAQGPSQTSVTTSQNLTTGNNVVIKGTVLDVASGTTQEDVAARFPNGLPCVSDDIMTPWMEHVYMHHNRPENITGVDVALSVISPDGSVQDLGTVTTDVTGYFHYVWSPPTTGTYTILAGFNGTNAYYASYGESSFVVSDLPDPTPTPTPTPAPVVDSYILGFTAAIIPIMAIAGAVIIMMLRKRP